MPCGIGTVVYAASTASLEDDVLYSKVHSLVSAKRAAKADGFRFRSDRNLSLGGELLLRFGLDAAGLKDTAIEYEYGINGKPYLKDRKAFFNISHSGEYAVCALSDSEVGCDIERIRDIDLNIAKRYFTQGEYEAVVSEMGRGAQNEMFFRYWTLKESFMKASGLGMRLNLNAFEIHMGKTVTVNQHVDGSIYGFAEFGEIRGYRCALCAVGGCDRIRIEIMDMADILKKIAG